MNARANPFNPRVILALILFGAAAFFATLYFIGSGQTGNDLGNGDGHASSNGLHGYSAFAALLEAEGHEVTRSRSPGDHDDYALLILTPGVYADPEDVSAILNDRTYVGPTLVILPKWVAFDVSRIPGANAKDGWVQLLGASEPVWPEKLDQGRNLNLELDGVTAPVGGQMAKPRPGRPWSGLGAQGRLPRAETLTSTSPLLIPLIGNDTGNTLAGYFDDGGYYPRLHEAAGVSIGDAENRDEGRWPVVFVVEPDLANNYGFASRDNPEVMHYLVDLLSEDGDIPVIFDLALNGLGAQQNLLTLAFTPPFLAATLCMILALLVVGWRAFRRFGPPASEDRAIAFGKERLVINGAALIQRSKRLHLLSGPYADMIERRIGKALRLRHVDTASVAAALARRMPDAPDYAASLAALRTARTPKDMLSAAAALKSIERMLTP